MLRPFHILRIFQFMLLHDLTQPSNQRFEANNYQPLSCFKHYADNICIEAYISLLKMPYLNSHDPENTFRAHNYQVQKFNHTLTSYIASYTVQSKVVLCYLGNWTLMQSNYNKRLYT